MNILRAVQFSYFLYVQYRAGVSLSRLLSIFFFGLLCFSVKWLSVASAAQQRGRPSFERFGFQTVQRSASRSPKASVQGSGFPSAGYLLGFIRNICSLHDLPLNFLLDWHSSDFCGLKVAFHALRFSAPIREMGNMLAQRMWQQGPYIALHLRMEKDVWVRTGCLPGLSREHDEMITQERISRPELLTGRSNMTYQERKLAGLCPLNALEVARCILHAFIYLLSLSLKIA